MCEKTEEKVGKRDNDNGDRVFMLNSPNLMLGQLGGSCMHNQALIKQGSFILFLLLKTDSSKQSHQLYVM